MRALVIGAAGTIGRRLVPALRERGHEVVGAGRTTGEVRVDLADTASIEAAFRAAGPLDAVVVVAAHGALDDFATLTANAMRENMRAKFFGQAEVVLTGQHCCNDRASFTLTSGIFADRAWPGVTGGGVISGALHAFVRSAALELPRGMRINAVSPAAAGAPAEGFAGMPVVGLDELAGHYLACVEGDANGRVIRAYG